MSQKPLLVVKPSKILSAEKYLNLKAQLSPIEDDYEIVIANGYDIDLHDVNLHQSIARMAENIEKLAESNSRLIDMVADMDGAEDMEQPAMTYMDGSKVSG